MIEQHKHHQDPSHVPAQVRRFSGSFPGVFIPMIGALRDGAFCEAIRIMYGSETKRNPMTRSRFQIHQLVSVLRTLSNNSMNDHNTRQTLRPMILSTLPTMKFSLFWQHFAEREVIHDPHEMSCQCSDSGETGQIGIIAEVLSDPCERSPHRDPRDAYERTSCSSKSQ
jgi:hypothetical protein